MIGPDIDVCDTLVEHLCTYGCTKSQYHRIQVNSLSKDSPYVNIELILKQYCDSTV